MKTVYLIIIILGIIITTVFSTLYIRFKLIDRSDCGAFHTDEWKDCFDECKMSMPLNLRGMGFNAVEIINIGVDNKCVYFCQDALYRKRIDKGCYQK